MGKAEEKNEKEPGGLNIESIMANLPEKVEQNSQAQK